MIRRRLGAAILFVQAASGAAGTPDEAIWRPSRAAVAELQKCGEPMAECVHAAMARHGGSPEAFEFYRRTGWFLAAIRKTDGPVKLALVLDPWRANENEQPALLGGTPEVVYPEEVDISLEDDGGYQALKKKFPNVMFWKPGPQLERSVRTAGGQRFIFRYRLLDGCHACAVLGRARIELDFAPDGAYRGAKVLGIIRR